jgi:hypothetical protein
MPGAATADTHMQRILDMLDLTAYGRLAQFTKLTARMVDDASKQGLAAAASMLAIQLGLYQRKFGAMPLEEAVELMESDALSEQQAERVADGLENLALALATVKDDEKPPMVQ